MMMALILKIIGCLPTQHLCMIFKRAYDSGYEYSNSRVTHLQFIVLMTLLKHPNNVIHVHCPPGAQNASHVNKQC